MWILPQPLSPFHPFSASHLPIYLGQSIMPLTHWETAMPWSNIPYIFNSVLKIQFCIFHCSLARCYAIPLIATYLLGSGPQFEKIPLSVESIRNGIGPQKKIVLLDPERGQGSRMKGEGQWGDLQWKIKMQEKHVWGSLHKNFKWSTWKNGVYCFLELGVEQDSTVLEGISPSANKRQGITWQLKH